MEPDGIADVSKGFVIGRALDLPDPEGPTIGTTSPRATSRLTPSRAVTLRLPSNCLETCERRITYQCTAAATATGSLERLQRTYGDNLTRVRDTVPCRLLPAWL